jgi:ribosomal peptide maturation radical SAM protein 1
MDIAITTKPRPVTDDPASLSATARETRAGWAVALVAMPFQDALRPSIQIGLLKAIVASHGFAAETLHLNLDLAARLGGSLYSALFAHDRARGAGDWLFSPAAFGGDAPDQADDFLSACADRIRLTPEEADQIRQFRRDGVDAYLEDLLAIVDWSRYRVVGFTSTFAQTVPSLALASRLKDRYPDLVTVFGGANLEGAMGVELVRSMPCVDYAITGEGDVAFTDLMIALSEGCDPAGLPGVLCRRDGVVVEPPHGAPFERLDDLPTPDYREYFERADHLGIVQDFGRHRVWLAAESSRGCWWGEKRHCTFCGLNGTTMAYRSKSATRLARELAELSAQTGTLNFGFVDNILDTAFFEDLFPMLNQDTIDYRFFFEVKANMTRQHVRTLRDGGVRRIQPGIESLSSHVLGLMRKGVRASQNVNLLRWARFYGIDVDWNLLYGFPRETHEDYRAQTDLMPKLVHLTPPGSAGRIWMERFSPIFEDRDSFPAKWVAPEKGLKYIFPDYVNLDRLAFFFDYEFEDSLPDSAFDEVTKAVEAWKTAYNGEVRPALTIHRAPGFIQIVDQRDPLTVGVHRFVGDLARLYEALMEKALTAQMVLDSCALPYQVQEVEEALDEFVARSLMMRDGNLFLSLALPASVWR